MTEENMLIDPAMKFAQYARAFELGEKIPQSVVDITGPNPTPYQVLQQLIPRSERRERGTFFTSSATANTLWNYAIESIESGAIVVDPACGAGNLLEPVAIKVFESKISNVEIRAYDINEDFVKIAVAQLKRILGTKCGKVEGFAVDFLKDASSVEDATHVVLNPPFVPVDISEPWAYGQTNAAALFTIRALHAMKPGARLLAILPDVLRSGSRYSAWRKTVEKIASLNRVEVHDVFDNQTDVHVFILEVTVGSSHSRATWNPSIEESTLKEYADIRVGAVVPHRDSETGPVSRYVTARSLSQGQKLFRRFSGRKESGPLILVNRTSRPGELPRVRARLLDTCEDVAVENHLLVIKPKDGVKISEIFKVLTSEETADFLDNRIRCRHLTVRALKEIPWLLS